MRTEAVETRPERGLTTADVARLLRVSEDKIRRWLRSGELVGVNTATTLSARPRWVISPMALEEFQRKRTSAPPPKPARKQRRSPQVDFYPD
jgi:hypothetical protein